MSMNFYMPTRLFTGENCIAAHAEQFACGSHALIVTGRHSAVASGAQADVTAVLEARGISYTVFAEISENPLASVCRAGGETARRSGADFVIGIGGGSALDAAKAIAAFAVCPDADESGIYTAELAAGAMLPILAVPTTAGTGSEVNPYAVLTLPGGGKKKTFKSIPGSYPRAAFVDPRYTYSLSKNYSVSTALDALAHAMESFLSPKSDDASEMFALYAARHIWAVLFCGADGGDCTDAGGFTPVQRSRLSLAATAAGVAINKTGTGFPHPLGYSITLSEGIPHGRACGAFAGAYIAYNSRTAAGEEKLSRFAQAIGTTVEEMAHRIPEMADVHLTLTAEQIAEHIDRVAGASNYANSPYVISRAEMTEIYTALFGAPAEM